MDADHDDHAADRGVRGMARPSCVTGNPLAALNASLCRAVGITDLANVAGVKVLIAGNESPRVIVTYRLRPGFVVDPVRQEFRLVPVDEPDERPPP